MSKAKELLDLIESKTIKVDTYDFSANLADIIGVSPDKLPMDLYVLSKKDYFAKNAKELKSMLLKELKPLAGKYDFDGLVIPLEGESSQRTGHGLAGSDKIGGIAAFGQKKIKTKEKPIKISRGDLT